MQNGSYFIFLLLGGVLFSLFFPPPPHRVLELSYYGISLANMFLVGGEGRELCFDLSAEDLQPPLGSTATCQSFTYLVNWIAEFPKSTSRQSLKSFQLA